MVCWSLELFCFDLSDLIDGVVDLSDLLRLNVSVYQDRTYMDLMYWHPWGRRWPTTTTTSRQLSF